MRSRKDWNGASRRPEAGRRGAGLVFLHVPVWVIVLYAFTTEDRTYQFPPPGLTLHWFAVAFAREDIWAAMRLSLMVAAVATALRDPARHAGGVRDGAAPVRRQGVDHAAVRPADRAARHHHRPRAARRPSARSRLDPGFWTIVAGHATFCLVIVYNNVVARLRRIPPSWVEASMDLGADGLQTFRYVLLPQIATALLAGGMLAFALSFDEIIVTLFTAGHQQTLPIWFYNELFRPRERPITNVVAVVVILVTLVPILLAYYLTKPDDRG